MKAAKFLEIESIDIVEEPIPKPLPKDILIKVIKS